MKKSLPSIATTLLYILTLTSGWSCKKGEETCVPPPVEYDRLNYVKSISSVGHYSGREVKNQYEISYDEAGSIESIEYLNAEGAVTSRELFDFQPAAIEIDYTSTGEKGFHYKMVMPIGLDGLVQSFYYDGTTQKWNYTYNNGWLTSLTHSESGYGLKNIRWSCGKMTGSDLVWNIGTEGSDPYLQKEPLTCSYSQYLNNYSIDINALVNTFLYPISGSLMPRLHGVSSINLLSRYTYTNPLSGTVRLEVTYKTDEERKIEEMTVTDLDYAEAGEDYYTVYTFTYCSPTSGTDK